MVMYLYELFVLKMNVEREEILKKMKIDNSSRLVQTINDLFRKLSRHIK